PVSPSRGSRAAVPTTVTATASLLNDVKDGGNGPVATTGSAARPSSGRSAPAPARGPAGSVNVTPPPAPGDADAPGAVRQAAVGGLCTVSTMVGPTYGGTRTFSSTSRHPAAHGTAAA